MLLELLPEEVFSEEELSEELFEDEPEIQLPHAVYPCERISSRVPLYCCIFEAAIVETELQDEA